METRESIRKRLDAILGCTAAGCLVCSDQAEIILAGVERLQRRVQRAEKPRRSAAYLFRRR